MLAMCLTPIRGITTINSAIQQKVKAREQRDCHRKNDFRLICIPSKSHIYNDSGY